MCMPKSVETDLPHLELCRGSAPLLAERIRAPDLAIGIREYKGVIGKLTQPEFLLELQKRGLEAVHQLLKNAWRL